jgi:hypothetical protein
MECQPLIYGVKALAIVHQGSGMKPREYVLRRFVRLTLARKGAVRPKSAAVFGSAKKSARCFVKLGCNFHHFFG